MDTKSVRSVRSLADHIDNPHLQQIHQNQYNLDMVPTDYSHMGPAAFNSRNSISPHKTTSANISGIGPNRINSLQPNYMYNTPNNNFNNPAVLNPTGPLAHRYQNYPLGSHFNNYKRKSVNIMCQFCHCNVATEVRAERGCGTWLACVGICSVGCFLGCCLIPFYYDDMKDVIHSCPNCYEVVGVARLLR